MEGAIVDTPSKTWLSNLATAAHGGRSPRLDVALAAVVAAFLLPIWVFPFFPTQDGPAHLANAIVLRDHLAGDTHVEQFYRIAWRPLPNWTCFALLAGLSCVFPPLVAEKVFVSLYVVGFAAAYRYFAASMGANTALISLAGFLLVFNRCLWMGFYNYCLSMVGYFVVLGYFLRRWERFETRHAVGLGGLLCLVYFTHLFGFILAAGSCLWLATMVPPRSLRKVTFVLAASAAGVALAIMFFHGARFVGDGVFRKLGEHLLGWVVPGGLDERLRYDVSNLEFQLFGIASGLTFTLGAGVALLYEFFMLASMRNTEASSREEKARRRAVIVLGVALAILYFLVPDMLVPGKGGFWKARIAPLPPLLWLACARIPPVKAVRAALMIGTIALLAVNLVQVSTFIRAGNTDLEEFTSGRGAVGRGRMLECHYLDGRQWTAPPLLRVNPLLHAVDYYCLNTGNLNLTRNFAMQLHSVVRLRVNLEKAPAPSDTILVWNDAPAPQGRKGFAIVFQEGRLKVLRKVSESAKLE